MSPPTAEIARHRPPGWLSAMKMAPLIGAGAWLMSVALASPSYWWLGWVTLLPLFLAIRFLPSFPAAACGALWGLCLYLFAAGERSSGVSASAWLMLTVIPGAFAGIAAEVTQRKGFHPLLLGLGWVGVELALKPLAMHHGLLASTQGDSAFVRLVGGLGGYAIVALLLAMGNAIVLNLITTVRLHVPQALELRIPREFELRAHVVEAVVVSQPFHSAIRCRAPPRLFFR